MYLLTNWCGSDLKNGEHYILLVSQDGKFEEVKARCLGNFPNSTIVGHLEYNEEFLVYTLFVTENLPLERFTFLRKLDLDYYKDMNYCKDREEVDHYFINKKALARAKDIKFKL